MQQLQFSVLLWMWWVLVVEAQPPPFLVYSPPSLSEVPPVAVVASHSTHRSIETLVVVLAVIVIVGLIAGIFARVCGGRRLAGDGDHDIEGWVERKCASCIDSGVSAAAAAATGVQGSRKRRS
ncbi:fission regulator-like protein [Cinnamomum micranthum f. kanehirae]|uniref:Fission regulator-like protein n=1 Tax=Cinnamomum micranthum f. kanehirae TaxID=337451 RepID=A0A3S3NDX7_9MAGN|nr:fission regulator-like protein [Cinnamomum micranthum f. kanehirae]